MTTATAEGHCENGSYLRFRDRSRRSASDPETDVELTAAQSHEQAFE